MELSLAVIVEVKRRLKIVAIALFSTARKKVNYEICDNVSPIANLRNCSTFQFSIVNQKCQSNVWRKFLSAYSRRQENTASEHLKRLHLFVVVLLCIDRCEQKQTIAFCASINFKYFHNLGFDFAFHRTLRNIKNLGKFSVEQGDEEDKPKQSLSRLRFIVTC